MRSTIALTGAGLLLTLFVPPVFADFVYDNGPWVSVAPDNSTAIGATPGQSYRLPAPIPPSTTGGGDRAWPVEWVPNNFDSGLDDFTIDSALTGGALAFHIDRVRIYAYESGATSTANTLTGGYLRLWNTTPSGPRLKDNDSRIAGGFMGTGADESDKLLPIPQVVADPLNGGAGRSVWTGVYRRDNSADVGTARPIIALDFDLSTDPRYPSLATGATYWLELSLLGSTAGQQAWVPTDTVKGARAMELSGNNLANSTYVDAAGVGTAADEFNRANIRPSLDFAFELYGRPVPVWDVNGDFNLNEDDYAVIDRDLAAARTGRLDGDLTGDHVIDSADYLILDTAWASMHAPAANPEWLALRESQFGADYVSQLLAAVPEPLLLPAFALFPILTRRSRR